MAYMQGAWRRREDKKNRKQLGLRVPPGFKERVKEVANKLKGRWDMADVLELGVGALEKGLAGETLDLTGMRYPLNPTEEEMREKLRDAGYKVRKPEGQS